MINETYQDTCEAARIALSEFYESLSAEFVVSLD
tara:strand:+ start:571 stop:672 length:102 start_codon:yes stop_codon:yes gene_type:complete